MIRAMSRRRLLLKTFAVSMAVLSVLAVLAYGLWSYVFSGLVTEPLGASGASSLGPTREAPHNDRILNILLIGTDSRDPATSRGDSDILMVLTVDRLHGSVKLLSILRDLYVPIPGYGGDKIKKAYSVGGAELAVRTVNENFGLDIQDYAVVDFQSAENLIDAMGGVEIDVKDAEIPYVNKGIREENETIFPDSAAVPLLTKGGLQRLVGRQAVSYARVRKLDSDFERTQRQRDVLKAMMAQFSASDLVTKTNILRKGLSCVTTNLTASEITWLSMEVLPLLPNGVKEMHLPTDGDYMIHGEGGWFMVPSRNSMIPKIQEFIWEQTFPFVTYAPIRVSPTPTLSPEPTPSAAPTSTPQPTPEPSPEISPEISPENTPGLSPTPEPIVESTAA